MDKHVQRLRAHLDQTRTEARHLVNGLPEDELDALVKTCAFGRVEDLDERLRLLVGTLAVVAVFDLRNADREEDRNADREGDRA